MTELLNLLLEISKKFENILKTKLLYEFAKLDKWKEEEIPVVAQYITLLGTNFKTDLLWYGLGCLVLIAYKLT